MTDISAAIGKRIRTFRNAQGISLEELSFKADLNAAHLGQIERGLRNPTIETLNRIATALDISFYELIGSRKSRRNNRKPMRSNGKSTHSCPP